MEAVGVDVDAVEPGAQELDLALNLYCSTLVTFLANGIDFQL